MTDTDCVYAGLALLGFHALLAALLRAFDSPEGWRFGMACALVCAVLHAAEVRK